MKLPITYYLSFWLKNSPLALATGGMVGFLSGMILFIVHPYFNNVSIGAGIFFLYFQYVSYKHFWGSKRGKFEYKFKQSQFKKKSNQLLKKKLGFLRYLLNHLHSSLLEDSCKELWDSKKITCHNEVYLLALIISKFARKDFYNFSEEIKFLKKALEMEPNDFLANFWMAIALEKTDSIKEANTHYRLALSDPEVSESKLEKHINDHIQRLNSEGPLSKPKRAGLRHFFW